MKLGLFILAAAFADDALYDDLANKNKCKQPSDCAGCNDLPAVSWDRVLGHSLDRVWTLFNF